MSTRDSNEGRADKGRTHTGAKRAGKVRQFQCEEPVWQQFEERLRRKGATPAATFRKVVRDFVDGRYVSLGHLTEVAELELNRRMAESGAGEVAIVIETLINEWAQKQLREREARAESP